MKLAMKMAEIGREVAYVQKQGRNSQQNYRYAEAEAVLQKVNEALFTRGIAVQMDVDHHIKTVEREGKGPMHLATVTLKATFVDGETGETMTSSGVGSGADAGDKAIMKAFTAAHKYLYAGCFCISWGDDPEATDADGKSTATPKEKKGKPAKAEPEASVKDQLLNIQKKAKLAAPSDFEALKAEVLGLRADLPSDSGSMDIYNETIRVVRALKEA